MTARFHIDPERTDDEIADDIESIEVPAHFDIVGWIIGYESGTLPRSEVLIGFSRLIASGIVWHLQGSYGRTAYGLIESGLITSDGEITELGRKFG